VGSKKEAEDALLQEILDAGLPVPERQYRFHPARKWPFDFAWLDQMIAVEVEGGAWIRGRHTRGKGFLNDCEKYNSAVMLGWRLIRVPTDWVDTGYIVGVLQELLDN